MKVLVIGKGGREDAICYKISKSSRLKKLFCSPGNAGTSRYAENVDLKNNLEIYDFAVENKIDLIIVGPEAYLCSGLVDLFKDTEIKVFGANSESAKLEGSKEFAKRFMEKYEIPTARYKLVFSYEEAKENLSNFTYPLVIKANGLCAGKGVKVCNQKNEAITFLDDIFNKKIFGDEGNKVVIEEFLSGIEASLLCFVKNDKLIKMESAKDYKRIFDNDKGENTGGVGAYSPSELFTPTLKEKIDEILLKISNGMKKENLNYYGILFLGLMIENNNPKILEFNVRFGDPETQVVLPRLENDLIDVILKTFDNTLLESDLKWSSESSLTVVLTSKGYPFEYEKGKNILGLNNIDNEIYVYHNNTKLEEELVLTDGGRVVSVTALGSDFNEIREKVYKNIEKINFDGMQYRTDIGIIKER